MQLGSRRIVFVIRSHLAFVLGARSTSARTSGTVVVSGGLVLILLVVSVALVVAVVVVVLLVAEATPSGRC